MKILIEAYLDKNFGDDVMVKMLIEELRDHEVFILCNDPILMKAFESFPNVYQVQKTSNLMRKIKQVKDYDAYIRIGGSLFNVVSNKMAIRWLLRLPMYVYLRMIKKKMAVIGCNIGPFNNRLGEIVTRLELKNMGLVTVRDKQSYDYLVKSKIKNIMVFPDMVLSYSKSSTNLLELGGGISNSENILEGGLGISAYRSINKRQYNLDNYKQMASIADEYIERTRKRVVLYAFDSENENDIAAAYNIFSEMKNKELAEICVYNGDIDEFINQLEKVDTLLSVRFHAAILAMNLKKQFVPVIYSNKMDNLLNDFQYSGVRLYLDNILEMPANEIVDYILKLNEKGDFPLRSEAFKLGVYHLLAARAYVEDDHEELNNIRAESKRFNERIK